MTEMAPGVNEKILTEDEECSVKMKKIHHDAPLPLWPERFY